MFDNFGPETITPELVPLINVNNYTTEAVRLFLCWKPVEQFITLDLSQVQSDMQASAEIRKKLATLIGSLISRCIQEARMIPHVLNREEVINLLVADPALYEKLVLDEHTGKTELSKEDLTVKVDVAKELERLDKLEIFDGSFWDGPETDLAPILDLINQLTRTYAVYLGNAATLFDREFTDFMNKFRHSLQRAGMILKTVDFTLDDVAVLEANATSYFSSGEFLQAFTFDRLLSSQIMMKQVVNLPSSGFSLRENLIRHGLKDPEMAPRLVRFVLRISYISQGSWQDLFTTLVRLIHNEAGLFDPVQLMDLIEQDVVFSCNLLCSSYTDIRDWAAAQRRQALENGLQNYIMSTPTVRTASQDL